MKGKRKPASSSPKKRARKSPAKVVSVGSPPSLAASVRPMLPIVTPKTSNTTIPAKFKGFKYFNFELKDGKDEYVVGEKKAVLFHTDYAGLIQNVRKFKSKAEFDKYFSRRPAVRPVVAPMVESPTKTSLPTADEIESARQLSMLTADDSPTNHIIGHYRTTSHSFMCAIVINFMSVFGGHSWIWKPVLMVNILSKMHKCVRITDPILVEALENMTHAYARDPDSPDAHKKLVKIFTPPGEPQKNIPIEEFRAYTYITIPVENLETTEQETEWLVRTIEALMLQIGDLMNSNVFELTLKKNQLKKDFINKIYDHNKKGNIRDFLNGVRGKASSVVHLTDHVIQPEADLIMTHLYKNRCVEAKYADDSDEQDDDESEAPADSDNLDNQVDSSQTFDEEGNPVPSEDANDDEDDKLNNEETEKEDEE